MPDLGPEHIDPGRAAFNEIVQREHHAEMLRIATPPWDIAAMDSVPGLPAQRQHLSHEAAQAICGSLLKEAAFMDVLFGPTFATVVNVVRWQDQLLPAGQRNLETLIDDAAFLVGRLPDPGDALQLREQIEYNAEKRGDHVMHQQFIAASNVLQYAIAEPIFTQLTNYAQASLSPSRRHSAFESVLHVVYGRRYEFWRSPPDLA